MKNKEYLDSYINRLIQKINQSQAQWNGTRFASVEDSSLQADEEVDDEVQYQQILQKYRGKNGSIKPLGLILFNKYLLNLFVLFFGLTLLFVPVALIESFGGGFESYKSISNFSKVALLFSVANLPYYRLDDLTEDQLSEITLHRYLILSTDIIAIFVIFCFVIYMKVSVAQVTSEYMAKSPAPNLYCLEIQNIQKCSEQQISEHFAKFGKIAQISLVYTNKDLIYDLRKVVKLITQLSHIKPDEKMYSEIVEQVQKKYKQLAINYFRYPKPEKKSAFLCYQEISTRNRVYDLYKYEINPQKLDLPTNNYAIEQQLDKDVVQMNTVQRVRPVVKKCKFEPLTINWQNCDIKQSSQNIKFVCQFLLLLLVAFVILLGLYLLNINSSHVRQNGTQSSSTLSFQRNFDNNKQIRQKYTFCASLTIADFKWEYYDLCSEYIELEKSKFALMLTFASMVAIINLLTNRILWALVAFRRYRTLAQRNSFLVTSIFAFSLINGAILILFMRGQNTGPILRKVVSTLLGFSEQTLEVAIYPQFNRNWYANIGAQLIMNYVVSLIVFPHFHILLHWVRTKYRQFQAKRSQKQVKKPIFNYCTFYALSLKSIFFSLVYSNSMPIFYPLCCTALIVQIYIGKILLKNFVDQPVFVDNNTIQVAMGLIPYSLLMHCITSILFLNVEQIFPLSSSYQNINKSWIQINLLKFQRGFIYVLIFIFLSIYIWNQNRIDFKIIRYWLGRSQTKAECDQTKKFKDIKNNPAFLASYRMKDNPKYKIIYYALQLFCSHMQKVRQLRNKHVQGESEDFNASSIFTQQQSISNRLAKNMSSMKQVNMMLQEDETPKIHQIFPSQTIKTSEQIESWSQQLIQSQVYDQKVKFSQLDIVMQDQSRQQF